MVRASWVTRWGIPLVPMMIFFTLHSLYCRGREDWWKKLGKWKLTVLASSTSHQELLVYTTFIFKASKSLSFTLFAFVSSLLFLPWTCIQLSELRVCVNEVHVFFSPWPPQPWCGGQWNVPSHHRSDGSAHQSYRCWSHLCKQKKLI